MAKLDTPDIQGFVLSSYSRNMPCANYVLLRVTDAGQARVWLRSIERDITNGEARKDDFCLNIAFTANALDKFGFSPADLQTFSVPFQEGMTTDIRKQILGDHGVNDPKEWSWGNTDSPVDILLLLFAKDEDMLTARLDLIDQSISITPGLQVFARLSAGRQPDTREHFGFLDGVGQPVIEGTGQKDKQFQRTKHATVVKAGEFVLGYENEMQKTDPLPETSTMQDFGRNGTYLVFRQMEQHVHTFWNFLKTKTLDTDGQSDVAHQERLAAKMVGRWLSGAPLTKYPEADPMPPRAVLEENDFNYASEDPDGFGCPIGAHIRRTNPRDSLFEDAKASLITIRRHRILRRGRSYGDRSQDVYLDDGKKRGLHFICLNSNIERQFEFIQQSWVNNQSFATLDKETDPLIGHRNGQQHFSIQGCPVRTRVHNLSEFVTIKGGAYFFMPGMNALKHLCEAK